MTNQVLVLGDCQKLANYKKQNIAIIPIDNPIDNVFYLVQKDDNWLIRNSRFADQFIDFADSFYRKRGGKEYLLNCFKNLANKKIIDATAGWGKDAWLLAYRGYHVVMIEQSPYLYILLDQAIKNAQNHPQIGKIANNLAVYFGDSYQFLKNTELDYSAIYLDPMYPVRKKSAKVKMAMQILPKIINQTNPKILNSDAGEILLGDVLQLGKKIIVKRPKTADFLVKKPDYFISSSNTRYDVYLPFFV